NSAVVSAPAGPSVPRDGNGHIDAAFIARIRLALEQKDGEEIKALAGGVHEADLGELISELTPDQRVGLVELLGRDFNFTALTELGEAVRVELVSQLPTDLVVEGM